jgi:hypothetical protein
MLYGYSLLLDVYTPSNARNSSALLVKVLLYGENNSGGSISDPEYLGCNSAKDAIVVTISYALVHSAFSRCRPLGLEGTMAPKITCSRYNGFRITSNPSAVIQKSFPLWRIGWGHRYLRLEHASASTLALFCRRRRVWRWSRHRHY